MALKSPSHGLQGQTTAGQWAEWFFRFVILNRLSHKSIHLNYWYEILRPPLSDTINNFSDRFDTIEILNGANSFADLTVTQAGTDVEITFANVTITLDSFNVADVDGSFFSF